MTVDECGDSQGYPSGYEYLRVEDLQDSPCHQCPCCWRRSPELGTSTPSSTEPPAESISEAAPVLPPPGEAVKEDLISLYWSSYWPFHGRAHRPSEQDGAAMQAATPLLSVVLGVVAVIAALGVYRFARRSTWCRDDQSPSPEVEATAASSPSTPLPLRQTHKLPMLLGSKPKYDAQAMLKTGKGVQFHRCPEAETDDEAI